MMKKIKPLPISEETLGAYIEGRLSVDEVSRINHLIENDNNLGELLEDFNTVDWEDPNDSIYDDFPNFEELFEIPQIKEFNDLSSNEDFVTQEKLNKMEEYTKTLQEMFVNADNSIDNAGTGETAGTPASRYVNENLNSEESIGNVGAGETAGTPASRYVNKNLNSEESIGNVGAGETAGTPASRYVDESLNSEESIGNVGAGETAGTPASRYKNGQFSDFDAISTGEKPLNIVDMEHTRQQYSDTCAIKSQQLVLEKFGINVSENELREEAYLNGWYLPGCGTPGQDMGKLLEKHGIECAYYDGGNILNVINELANGKQIIMAVDSGELWHDKGIRKIWEKLEDKIPYIGGSDHALMVTGIDASDIEDIKVVVTDPGSGDLNKAYPLEQFVNAAQDSNFYMVVTKEPTPHIFDGFAEGTTHLPMIGNMDYCDFLFEYQNYLYSPYLYCPEKFWSDYNNNGTNLDDYLYHPEQQLPSNVFSNFCSQAFGIELNERDSKVTSSVEFEESDNKMDDDNTNDDASSNGLESIEVTTSEEAYSTGFDDDNPWSTEDSDESDFYSNDNEM